MDVLKRNNVTVMGQGQQTLVLAHGFGCDQNIWRFVTPRFLATHRLVLYDHVGAGGSQLTAYSPYKYGQLEGYADDLLDICRALNLERVVGVGHSVGAMITMLAAMQAPECFERLVLVTPSPCYINEPGYVGGFERTELEELLKLMDDDYQHWTQVVAPLIVGNPAQPELWEELAASFCRTDPTIARQFARVTFLSDNRSDLPRLRTPSLILQCRDDLIAPPEVGHYLQQHLRGSQLVTLDATGHCPHLSAPLATVAALEDYLLD
ncbi:alpha/beta fold hydrolase [Hymenobacter sp. B81]|uniref:alpha/beta fold hydrolase n=1 Tax=Hymenobacter sp. B81 TaxID=3344878 RepID=UPI0037DD04DC